MKILGIESSCDETAVALYDSHVGLLGHKLFSQVAIHREFGGVVPELASRDHIKKLPALVKSLLNEVKLSFADIDGIAYTKGPGLQGALLVGATFAKSLAFALDIPALGVNHLEGHLWAALLEQDKPKLPFVMLLVSGGHTQLLYVRALGDYELLGETLDDACGEAFDKTAKLLGLSYPGGPALAKLAESGNENAYSFSKPMVNRQGLDMSFSGLKTQVANTWHHSDKSQQTKANIAASFQKTVCETLLIKCKRALIQTECKQLVCAGGVGANLKLREKLRLLMNETGGACYFPSIEFCTDNGAMIAYLGTLLMQKGLNDCNLNIEVRARWPIEKHSTK